MTTQATKTKGMCIATRCTSVEQFIQMFHRFVDEESFFVSTLNTRAPGLETSFSVQLADGTPVLRGLCVVMQAWTTPANPFKTPGVRLGIKRLTANSMAVFEQLLITRKAAKPPALPATPPRPSALAAVIVAKPGTPKPFVKSPFTETAPTKHAASRIELSQPARPTSEPSIADAIPRAVTVETTDVTEEKTDVRERKPLPIALPVPPPLAPLARAKPIEVPRSIEGPRAIESPKPIEVPKAIIMPRSSAQKPLDARAPIDTPGPSEPPTPLAAPRPIETATPAAGAPAVVPPAAIDVADVARPLATAEPVPDETRTPGSDFVLPANPLMNLTDESLEGYVDCTLYEETGNFFPADDDASFGDDVAPPPRPVSEPVPLAAAPAGGPRADTDLAVASYDTQPSTLVTPPPAGSPLPRDGASLDPAVTARGSTPVLPSESAPSAQTADDAPSIEIESAPPPSKLPLAPPISEEVPVVAPLVAPRVMRRPDKRQQRMLLIGGAGVAVAALAVLIVLLSSAGGETRPPAPAVKQTAAVAATDTPREQPSVVASVEPPDEPEPARDGPPVVGSGPCKVVVQSTPAGSMVKLDGTSVGPSPITVSASCDKHKVDVVHPRYAPASRTVALAEGEPETLEVTLSRPTHVVSVYSTPPGATVFIDGRRAGTTPTKLSVLGFVTLKLDFKKTGYQPTTEKFYSRRARDKVSVKLTKW